MLETANNYDVDHFVKVFVLTTTGNLIEAKKALDSLYAESPPSSFEPLNHVRTDRARAKRFRTHNERSEFCHDNDGFLSATAVNTRNHGTSMTPPEKLLNNRHEVNIRFQWGSTKATNYYRDNGGKGKLKKDLGILSQIYVERLSVTEIAKDMSDRKKALQEIYNLQKKVRGFFR